MTKITTPAQLTEFVEEVKKKDVNWKEDAKHENGNYQCICYICGRTFIGHKRRVVCKRCDLKNQMAEALIYAAQEIERLRNAVVILPEGAEPKKGDVIETDLGEIFKVRRIGFSNEPDDKEFVAWLEGSSHYILFENIGSILLRNGKPVIYEQVLQDNGEK